MRANSAGSAELPMQVACFATPIPPLWRSFRKGRRSSSFLCLQPMPAKRCDRSGCDSYETVLIAAAAHAVARYSPSQMEKELAMHSESQSFKQRIPWLMAATRVVLGPAMIMAQRSGWNGLTLAAMVIAALLSDIFDGVLARRWRCDTAGIRLFDSMADNIFYLGCGTSLWMRQPVLIRSLAVPIGIVLGIEVLKFVFDFAKFGKPSSYHSYLAK